MLAPWLNKGFDRLKAEIGRLATGPERLRRVLTFLWMELPRADNLFVTNLMIAQAAKKPADHYSRNLLISLEQRATDLLDISIGPDPLLKSILPDSVPLAFMCHDGFFVNWRLVNEIERILAVTEVWVAYAFPAGGQQLSVFQVRR